MITMWSMPKECFLNIASQRPYSHKTETKRQQLLTTGQNAQVVMAVIMFYSNVWISPNHGFHLMTNSF